MRNLRNTRQQVVVRSGRRVQVGHIVQAAKRMMAVPMAVAMTAIHPFRQSNTSDNSSSNGMILRPPGRDVLFL